MLIKEQELLNIIEEETMKALQEGLLTEQTRWRIPGDSKYEYSLTSDGKGYIAYENEKILGTYRDEAGLKSVRDAAPVSVSSSWSEWFKGKLGIGEQDPQNQVDPWARESDSNGPIHKIQKALGVSADGVFGSKSLAAWKQKTNSADLPGTPTEAMDMISDLSPPEKVDSPYDIKYFSTLKGKLKVIDEEKLIRGAEARGVVECKVDACAQFVSDNLSEVYTTIFGVQGNAWLAHRWWLPGLNSIFVDKASSYAEQAATIFSLLNTNKGSGLNKQISSLVRSLASDQNRFSKLSLGTVVGLYYPQSTNHSIAFFEAATEGNFFVTEKGKKWTKEMMGQKIKFLPSEGFSEGSKSFGMNTHLGFVGATYKGEPIIFHNVHGDVRATPLRAMSLDKLAIVWSRQGGGGGRLGRLGSKALKLTGLGEQAINESTMAAISSIAASSTSTEAAQSLMDLWRGYSRMKEANTKLSDKYFHCIAHCMATSRGPVGEAVSYFVGWAREASDSIKKGDSDEQVAADYLANSMGRFAAKNMDCGDCWKLIPNGLPEEYWILPKDMDMQQAKKQIATHTGENPDFLNLMGTA
mgnify:CR=1 FL=1